MISFDVLQNDTDCAGLNYRWGISYVRQRVEREDWLPRGGVSARHDTGWRRRSTLLRDEIRRFKVGLIISGTADTFRQHKWHGWNSSQYTNCLVWTSLLRIGWPLFEHVPANMSRWEWCLQPIDVAQPVRIMPAYSNTIFYYIKTVCLYWRRSVLVVHFLT